MLRKLVDASVSAAHIDAAICVIGGGVAELLTAVEAGRTGRRVVMLESGDRKPNHNTQKFNKVEQEAETYETAMSGRVRSLGGTSTVWGGRMIPLIAHDMSTRSYVGLPGWPLKKEDIEGWLHALERSFHLDHSSNENHCDGAVLPVEHEGLAARWAKWPRFWRRNVAHVLSHSIMHWANLDVLLEAVIDLQQDARRFGA